MDIREELKSGGAYPTGPVSAWPQSRHESLLKNHKKPALAKSREPKVEVEMHVRPENQEMPGVTKMASGLLKSAGQAIRHGRVSEEVRNERYDMCKACPKFNPDSKRCASCGCFMEAKSWIGGDPNKLCPLKKWKR